MTNRVHSRRVCSARRLATLDKMREDKARRRQERIAAGWTPEPRFRKDYPLEIGFRDTRSGEVAWCSLKSARQAKRLARRMLQEWVETPGRFGGVGRSPSPCPLPLGEGKAQ